MVLLWSKYGKPVFVFLFFWGGGVKHMLWYIAARYSDQFRSRHSDPKIWSKSLTVSPIGKLRFKIGNWIGNLRFWSDFEFDFRSAVVYRLDFESDSRSDLFRFPIGHSRSEPLSKFGLLYRVTIVLIDLRRETFSCRKGIMQLIQTSLLIGFNAQSASYLALV